MPTITAKPTRSTVPAEALALDHLHAHPALQPLLSRRAVLRERLDIVNDAVRVARRELHTLDGDSFSDLSARRRRHTQLETLEEEGSAIEGELTPLHEQIAVVKEQAKAELRHLLVEEGAAVTAALLDALERLAEAGNAYGALYQRSYRLLEAPIVPQVVNLYFLPQAIRRTKEILARLQARV